MVWAWFAAEDAGEDSSELWSETAGMVGGEVVVVVVDVGMGVGLGAWSFGAIIF